ncbi:hypothetical protein ACOSP7_030303 [Xanthoceras sorbifolium]|uniref:GrpE protein homolog n=1 Tax=Xanthoceras sorbifolium TaxID=99658 RepID=A0ABQ8H2P1_9ROSI|nr:hypothetical protein JRO89_XS15G0167800 [Xanthoceras sorbifolium]
MLTSRVLSRASRSVGGRSLLLAPGASAKQLLPTLSNQFHSLVSESSNKLVSTQVTQFHHSAPSASIFQRFGFSSASPEPNEKEHGNDADSPKPNGDAKASDEVEDAAASEGTKESGFNSEPQSTMSQSDQRRRRGTKRTAFSDSDSDSESELSRDDLVKLVMEKEELLKAKHEEIENMKDKVLRSLAEMENIKDRTRREAENSKKFAIQNFAKSLLDVADNLGRASSVVKESFSKIDTSTDSAGAVPLLKSLLDGVEMTEKQLGEVFKKFGLEKFDPTNEPFDPHRHYAVFQVPDNSKPPGTVAHVLKSGYMLYDRVIRPAEVGVTHEVETEAAENKEA